MPKEINLNKIVVISGLNSEKRTPSSCICGGQFGLYYGGVSDCHCDDEKFLYEYPAEVKFSRLGWKNTPERVLKYYNMRRARLGAGLFINVQASIAELEARYEVVVVTESMDNCYELCGLTKVIHLYGQLVKAKSSIDSNLKYDIGHDPIHIGHTCEKGSQLMPDAVFFGEPADNYEEACRHISDAGRILVIDASLDVLSIIGLLKKASCDAEKVVVDCNTGIPPFPYIGISSIPDKIIPMIVRTWLKGKNINLELRDP